MLQRSLQDPLPLAYIRWHDRVALNSKDALIESVPTTLLAVHTAVKLRSSPASAASDRRMSASHRSSLYSGPVQFWPVSTTNQSYDGRGLPSDVQVNTAVAATGELLSTLSTKMVVMRVCLEPTEYTMIWASVALCDCSRLTATDGSSGCWCRL